MSTNYTRNITRVRQQTSNLNQHDINLKLLENNTEYKTISISYEEIGNKKKDPVFKCTVKYSYKDRENDVVVCKQDKDNAKKEAFNKIVNLIEHFQRAEVQFNDSSSGSNDQSISPELIYEGLKGCIIRCSNLSIGGLEYGLYYADGIEPKNVRKDNIQKILTYNEASAVSMHPWLHILMLFGNNIKSHNKSRYYILCGDQNDINYTSVATTIEELGL